jgi:D-galactarolactone cycloisomerase
MRITSIKVRGGDLSALTFVEVDTDEGITGIGVTGSPSCIIEPIIKHGSQSLEAMLLGHDPRNTRTLWHKMFMGWQAHRSRGAEGGIAVNAMAAIDMALWDLTGKAHDLPIYKLLGGAVQKEVMAYASATAFKVPQERNQVWLALKSAEELSKECLGYLGRGFKAIKFGWANHFTPADEERLVAIREAVGNETRLMIDFGCPAYWTPGWNATAAIKVAHILEKYGVYFFEEPMPPQDVDGHTRVTRAVEINVATGESLSTIHEFRRFIDARAVDIIQPDSAQIGMTTFLDVIRAAEQAGMLCVPHSPWSATVVAAHLQLLATTPSCPMIEFPAHNAASKAPYDRVTWMAHHDIVERPLELRDGHIQLPTLPGLGLGNYVEEAVSALEAYAAEE